MNKEQICIKCTCGSEIMQVGYFPSENKYNVEIQSTCTPNHTEGKRITIALSYIFENESEVTRFVIGGEDALRLLMFISSTQKIHCWNSITEKTFTREFVPAPTDKNRKENLWHNLKKLSIRF